MSAKRSYTQAEKDEACLLYVEHGPTEVERRLGIPKGTVLYWATQRNVRTVRNQKTAEATEAAVLDALASAPRSSVFSSTRP